MKNLRIYNTETERTADISNMPLPYIQVVRDTDYSIFGDGAGAYIQDGLVFQLDGIHKGPTANAWTDLVGGKVFTNTGCTPLVKGWQITNTTSTYNSLRNNDTLAFGSGSYATHTIEIVYNTSLTRGQILFLPKTANSIIFCIASNKYFYLRSSTSQKLYATPNQSSPSGLHTVSLNINGGLIDGTTSLSQVSNTDYFGVGSWNGIGARSTNATYSFDGIIYAIRVYNRLLSAEEMQHNQKKDIRRFF